MAAVPSTHKAVAITGARQPLVLIDVPTVQPEAGEVIVQVRWIESSPLDLHQADGGLLIETPYHISGSTFAGVVAALGPDVTSLKVGDRVGGFAHEKLQHKSQQEYITIPSWRVFKSPENVSLQAAATVGSSLVTAIHSITADLGLPLPWPVPQGWEPEHAGTPILLWGAAGSAGIYAVQVLRHWGYKNVLAVASAKHHEYLRSIGAAATFDYNESDVTEKILAHVGEKGSGARIPFILDCIGMLHGTLEPITRVAETGSTVAILLPVIVRDATDEEAPAYEMDVTKCHEGKWAKDVELRGVRTHFYAQNQFFKEHLQPDIIPALLEQGIVGPLKQRVVEGETLLERAQNALHLLRSRAPSGERLVWKVAE